jgi:hypothetical protein
MASLRTLPLLQGGKIKKLLEQLAAAREADGEEPGAAGEDDDDDA